MKKSTWLIVLLHMGYWLSTGTQPIYMFFVFRWNTVSQTASAQFTSILLAPIAFYTFYFFVFPFLQRRQIAKFIAYSAVSAITCVFVGLIIFDHCVYKGPVTRNSIITIGAFYFPLRVISSAIMACILKGFVTWFTEIKYKQQLEKKNLETNLALLKAQINPHFLFNTLNNIDVLIEKDPTTASVYLKKLSDILRFTLYESPAERITLQQEAEYITQYIELQKIRTANPDFVKFETEGDLSKVSVAPMLFIPFIENAFKHSTNKKITNAIDIKISARSGNITFVCSNAYDAEAVATQANSGLGLELTSSRLQLLYQNNYSLDLDKTADRFTVNLSITLNEH